MSMIVYIMTLLCILTYQYGQVERKHQKAKAGEGEQKQEEPSHQSLPADLAIRFAL